MREYIENMSQTLKVVVFMVVYLLGALFLVYVVGPFIDHHHLNFIFTVVSFVIGAIVTVIVLWREGKDNS